MAKADLTAQQVRELFVYDAATGTIARRDGRRGGRPAGSINENGYRRVYIQGFGYYTAHRIIWLYHYGDWPKIIDHINGKRSDNRIENLREVSTILNNQNLTSAKAQNVSGLLGVSKRGNGKFTATIKANLAGRTVQLYLGLYNTAEDAHAVYVDAKRRLHDGCSI